MYTPRCSRGSASVHLLRLFVSTLHSTQYTHMLACSRACQQTLLACMHVRPRVKMYASHARTHIIIYKHVRVYNCVHNYKLCTGVCMYTLVRVRACTRPCVCARHVCSSGVLVFAYVCMDTCPCACMCACELACLFPCMRVCACVWMCLRARNAAILAQICTIPEYVTHKTDTLLLGTKIYNDQAIPNGKKAIDKITHAPVSHSPN